MDLLLRHGMKPLAESDEKITALHVAADIGSITLVQELMSVGLRLDACSSSGATALHFACKGAHHSPGIVRFLTDHGLKPIEKDMDGNTPLHYAAASCNREALAELLSIGLKEEVSKPGEASNEIGPPNKEVREAPVCPRKLAQFVNLRKSCR